MSQYKNKKRTLIFPVVSRFKVSGLQRTKSYFFKELITVAHFCEDSDVFCFSGIYIELFFTKTRGNGHVIKMIFRIVLISTKVNLLKHLIYQKVCKPSRLLLQISIGVISDQRKNNQKKHKLMDLCLYL